MKIKELKQNIREYLKSFLIAIFEKYLINEEYFIEKYSNKFPRIMTVQQTINELITTNKSIIRFGDGELELIKGGCIPFQKCSQRLSNRLKEVLSSSDSNILIAVPSFIYSSKANLQEIPKSFWSINGKRFRDTIAEYISTDNIYYASEFTIAFSAYKGLNISRYFDDLKKIWHNKDLTLICGETVFDKIEHNIFDNANSIEYIYAPSINAFDTYDKILQSCLLIDKNRLLIAILGPTAKVLAYDLAQRGYRTLDLGHIAKSYDWYCRGKNTIQMNDAIDFFNPD